MLLELIYMLLPIHMYSRVGTIQRGTLTTNKLSHHISDKIITSLPLGVEEVYSRPKYERLTINIW